MSISTYSELQTAIASWSSRNNLTDKIPDFIMLAEKDFLLHKLRVREMLAPRTGYVTAAAGDNVVPYPAGGFTEVHLAQVTGTGTLGDVVAVDGIPLERLSITTGRSLSKGFYSTPLYFADTPDNTGWEIYPVPGNFEVTFWVWAKIIPLSDAAPTNVILTHYPQIYLTGALHQLEKYLKVPPAESQGWGQDFIGSINAASVATRRAMFAGTTLRTRSTS